MKRIQGVQIEKKDPKAWERLDAIGKEINKSWKRDNILRCRQDCTKTSGRSGFNQ